MMRSTLLEARHTCGLSSFNAWRRTNFNFTGKCKGSRTVNQSCQLQVSLFLRLTNALSRANSDRICRSHPPSRTRSLLCHITQLYAVLLSLTTVVA
jgi:hypothetical protein